MDDDFEIGDVIEEGLRDRAASLGAGALLMAHTQRKEQLSLLAAQNKIQVSLMTSEVERLALEKERFAFEKEFYQSQKTQRSKVRRLRSMLAEAGAELDAFVATGSFPGQPTDDVAHWRLAVSISKLRFVDAHNDALEDLSDLKELARLKNAELAILTGSTSAKHQFLMTQQRWESVRDWASAGAQLRTDIQEVCALIANTQDSVELPSPSQLSELRQWIEGTSADLKENLAAIHAATPRELLNNPHTLDHLVEFDALRLDDSKSMILTQDLVREVASLPQSGLLENLLSKTLSIICALETELNQQRQTLADARVELTNGNHRAANCLLANLEAKKFSEIEYTIADAVKRRCQAFDDLKSVHSISLIRQVRALRKVVPEVLDQSDTSKELKLELERGFKETKWLAAAAIVALTAGLLVYLLIGGHGHIANSTSQSLPDGQNEFIPTPASISLPNQTPDKRSDILGKSNLVTAASNNPDSTSALAPQIPPLSNSMPSSADGRKGPGSTSKSVEKKTEHIVQTSRMSIPGYYRADEILTGLGNGFHMADAGSNHNQCMIKSKEVSLLFEADSKRLLINQMVFVLQKPLIKKDADFWISKLDFERVIQPIIHPHLIGQQPCRNLLLALYRTDSQVGLSRIESVAASLREKLNEKGVRVVTWLEGQPGNPIDIANQMKGAVLIQLVFANGIERASSIATSCEQVESVNFVDRSPTLRTALDAGIALAASVHSRALTKLRILDKGIRVGPLMKFRGARNPAIRIDLATPSELGEAGLDVNDWSSILSEAVLGFNTAIGSKQ